MPPTVARPRSPTGEAKAKRLDPKVRAEMARTLRRDGFTLRAIAEGLHLKLQTIAYHCRDMTCGN